jgi:hypothetical protein
MDTAVDLESILAELCCPSLTSARPSTATPRAGTLRLVVARFGPGFLSRGLGGFGLRPTRGLATMNWARSPAQPASRRSLLRRTRLSHLTVPGGPAVHLGETTANATEPPS